MKKDKLSKEQTLNLINAGVSKKEASVEGPDRADATFYYSFPFLRLLDILPVTITNSDDIWHIHLYNDGSNWVATYRNKNGEELLDKKCAATSIIEAVYALALWFHKVQ